MSSHLSHLLLFAYPPSWRRRYALELQALLETEPLTFAVVINLIGSGAGEWLRAGWRAPARPMNAKILFGLTLESAVFIWFSTMTSVSYERWLAFNAVFGLLLTGTAFVRAVAAGWLNGFLTASLAAWGFVVMLLSWIAAASDQMVQLPFDHFDVLSRGSVSGYLAGSGYREFAVASLLLAGAMTVVLALMAWAGAGVGRLANNLQEVSR